MLGPLLGESFRGIDSLLRPTTLHHAPNPLAPSQGVAGALIDLLSVPDALITAVEVVASNQLFQVGLWGSIDWGLFVFLGSSTWDLLDHHMLMLYTFCTFKSHHCVREWPGTCSGPQALNALHAYSTRTPTSKPTLHPPPTHTHAGGGGQCRHLHAPPGSDVLCPRQQGARHFHATGSAAPAA